MATDSEFRTQSLQLAAFILARGADLPAISGEHGRLVFHFADSEEKLGWERELFEADEPVGAKTMLWAYKEMRAQMNRYAQEHGGEPIRNPRR